ncbi:hypothetical protein pb186bvf_004569 [Paramecium bursaria]
MNQTQFPNPPFYYKRFVDGHEIKPPNLQAISQNAEYFACFGMKKKFSDYDEPYLEKLQQEKVLRNIGDNPKSEMIKLNIQIQHQYEQILKSIKNDEDDGQQAQILNELVDKFNFVVRYLNVLESHQKLVSQYKIELSQLKEANKEMQQKVDEFVKYIQTIE